MSATVETPAPVPAAYPALAPTPVLGVGVIGHRHSRLPRDPAALARLEASIEAVLGEIRAALAAVSGRPEAGLRVLTSLAEGADRMGARAALAQGHPLDVVLPMPPAAYEADFATVDSRAQFADLLARADRAVVLDFLGEAPVARDRMYALAVDYLLEHADILIAVWDGQPAAGKAGTPLTLDRAAALGMPLIIVPANGIDAPYLQWSALEAEALHTDDATLLARHALAEVLRKVVAGLVLPPPPGAAGTLANLEQQRAGKPPLERLEALFDAADALAMRYAGRFRLAVTATFVLAGLATTLAVLGLASLIPEARDFSLFAALYKGKIVITTTECVLLLAILVLVHLAQRRFVHTRWIRYRHLAEQARVARELRRVSLRGPTAKGVESDWTAWLVRALQRHEGLPPLQAEAKTLEQASRAFKALAEDQAGYHERAAARAHGWEHRLEVVGLCFFVAAVVAVIGGILFGGLSPLLRIGSGLLAVMLPVIGSALLGIRFVRDYAGIHARSHAMAQDLAGIARRLSHPEPDARRLRLRALELARILLHDVFRWRLHAESRKLDLPG